MGDDGRRRTRLSPGSPLRLGGRTAYPPPVANPPGDPSAAVRRPRRGATLVLGLASLANGAALVLHIVAGLSLPLLLTVIWIVAVLSIVGIATVGGPSTRASIVRVAVVGLAVGIGATLAYDATKAVLSQLDPSPFDPFEATRVFGRILVGEGAAPWAIATSGWAFHLANGSTFAVAYAALFARDGRVSRRRGIIAGVGWALLLETFQLILYPGWLDIRFLDEFRQISFLSHVVYGVGLGVFVPAALRRARLRSNHKTGVING